MISEYEILIQTVALKDLVKMAKRAAVLNIIVVITGSVLQIAGLILLWQAMK